MCVTTSRDPSSRLKQFAKELKLVVPNAQRINRGNHKVRDTVSHSPINHVFQLFERALRPSLRYLHHNQVSCVFDVHRFCVRIDKTSRSDRVHQALFVTVAIPKKKANARKRYIACFPGLKVEHQNTRITRTFNNVGSPCTLSRRRKTAVDQIRASLGWLSPFVVVAVASFVAGKKSRLGLFAPKKSAKLSPPCQPTSQIQQRTRVQKTRRVQRYSSSGQEWTTGSCACVLIQVCARSKHGPRIPSTCTVRSSATHPPTTTHSGTMASSQIPPTTEKGGAPT